MDALFTSENLIALVTLVALEIVLGIDNVVFVTIVTDRLPEHQRSKGRRVGLTLAMGMRILLLFAISWVMGLTKPLFTLMDHTVSGRDIILLVGGLFLIGKATIEIHHKIDMPDEDGHQSDTGPTATMGAVLVQIALLDMVFSLDSVITAIGMADRIAVMVAAIVASVGIMMIFADAVANFVEHHPTLKMLALSFLILIGVMLLVEGFGKHVDKGYIYFAMTFSLVVEVLNMRMRKVLKARAERKARTG